MNSNPTTEALVRENHEILDKIKDLAQKQLTEILSIIESGRGKPVEPVMDIVSFEKCYQEMGEFAKATFPDATSKEHIIKLILEAKEVLNNLGDITEYADCLLALIGAAYKEGFGFNELLDATDKKLAICRNRKWIKQPDGTYQHDSGKPEPVMEDQDKLWSDLLLNIENFRFNHPFLKEKSKIRDLKSKFLIYRLPETSSK